MKTTTIFLTIQSMKGLDELVTLGHYPSRSEAIRMAIRDLLQSEGAWKMEDGKKSARTGKKRLVTAEDGRVIVT